ncbi:MAG: RNA 2',3'-cyclic phosphodiesterase [Bacillota bacterium]
MSEDSWRLFVAVHLPPDLVSGVTRVQDQLRRSRADVKWVEEENLHLTLKFLGEVPEGRVPSVREALTAVGEVAPFRVSLRGVGAFPGPGSPKVVWVGLSDGASEFVRLAGAVDRALAARGFARERRPASPHLTIGRVRGPSNLEALRRGMDAVGPAAIGSFECREARLYRSVLGTGGPVYTVLETIPLRSSPA